MLEKLRNTNTVFHIIYVIIVLLLIEGVVYAKYIYSMSASGSLNLGIMITDVIDITSAINSMKPGDTRQAVFKVSNTKDGTRSDVAQSYSIKIMTANTLPLKYEVYCTDNDYGIGTEESPVEIQPGFATTEKAILTNLDHVTHTYVLKISWENLDGSYSSEYSELSDYAYIEINSEQVPVATN